ncbi:MAG TPA: FAD-binding oxidoreductase [Acetobacteraceae bacterium]|nr:FAD-binding oxidoreductase [Acetobacteraceae bacterium]
MELIDALSALLGPSGLLRDAGDIAPYGADWRGLYNHPPRAVLRPADTEQLAGAVRLCAAAGIPLVPQGGNTSLVAGAVPSAAGREFVLSLNRMDRLRSMDRQDLSMVVEAGMTLARAQEIAADAGALLPLSISSEGSARIGGVLATNAGGNNTLRFGNARDLVLGLEVVLADGSVWHGLRRLRKDNTGYALKHLFIGSEGTLGIIAAAALRLHPAPRARATALCALPSVEAVLDLFTRFRDEDDSSIYAFEYISGPAMEVNLRHVPGGALPLAGPAPHYALVELATTRRSGDPRETLELVLESALEAGAVSDAAIAESESHRIAFWRLREHLAESQKREGESIKNDVSVPVSAVPELLARAGEMLAGFLPGSRMVAFGHIGDGNIHLNLLQPRGADGPAFMRHAHEVMERINEIVHRLGGSFSAEHGVGMIKRDAMERFRGGVERGAMRRIKQALDPHGLFNPGKLF